MHYVGFDLGDGESCLAYYDSAKKFINDEPEIVLVDGKKSFPTAVATLRENGDGIIGYNAISSSAYADDLRVCFKKQFRLADQDVYGSYRRFVTALLNKLRDANLPFSIDNRDEYRFVVGYPADWDRDTVGIYADLLASCGIVNPYMVSESRAALVYFRTCRCVDFPKLNDSSPVLVCDFGSSTLDFAYMPDGNVENVRIFGHSNLGGGIIDRRLVIESLEKMTDANARADALRVFDADRDVRSLLMFEARKLKELYFNTGKRVSKDVAVFRSGLDSVTLVVGDETVRAAISTPLPECGNQSVKYTLEAKFSEAAAIAEENPPKLVILTGGASRMEFFREICASAFSGCGAEIAFSRTPETDIACGLALDGNYMRKLGKLKEDIALYRKSGEIEALVKARMPSLYERLASALVDELVRDDSVSPGEFRIAFREWMRAGDSIDDLCSMFGKSFAEYSGTPSFDALVSDVAGEWLSGIVSLVQEKLNGLCVRHGVNPAQADLAGFSPDGKIRTDNVDFNVGKDIQQGIVAVFGAVTTVIVSSLSGGAGIALIAAGPVGILAGAALVLMPAFLLRKQAEGVVRKTMKIPYPVRKLFVTESRMFSQKSVRDMKDNCRESLCRKERLGDDITESIMRYVGKSIHELEIQTKV